VHSADVIVLLAAATLGLIAGRAMRLPPIVSYLVAGLLVGPSGLGLVSHSGALDQLAEIGVALLLFGVGIEFSLDHLRRIWVRMAASGGLQVGLSILGSLLLFRWLGASWTTAIFIGFLVSLSSTAIVFKLYDESGEIDAPQGQAALGILLFQDLALVPMMLLVPVLAQPHGAAVTAIGIALVSAAGTLGGLLFLARFALPRGLALVMRTGTPELFPLVALVIAFGTALAASRLGLSLPIGAFLAGLALSGSPYSHQVFAELLPLRDAFVAVFFTSIGMLLQPSMIAADPVYLLGMIGAVAGKAILIAGLVWLLWGSMRLAILTGMMLAQIGEFSFVLAREGAVAGVITAQLEQCLLGAAVLTMAATPFMKRAATRLAAIELPGSDPRPAEELKNHVLVIGYGTTGQAVARVLRETGISFVAVDILNDSVEAARREGLPVRFGDASRRGVLIELGVERARAAIVAVSDPVATRRIVSMVRQSNRTARILVRVRRVQEIGELERLGADEVIPSEFETSIELFVRLLTHLGVPRHVVRVQESIIRLDHYRALRGVGASAEILSETSKLVAGGIVERAQVMKGCEAAGKTLNELQLRRRTGAMVLTVVRAETPLPPPDGTTRLETGDYVVLFGPHDCIDKALELLEPQSGDESASA
jgi:K+:H+ antiporter